MALIERVQKTTDATAWRGEIPMSYVYTAGRAQGPFFEALRDEGRFIGTRCEKCGVTLCPPQMYCERCFGRIEKNTVEVPNRGAVHTFTGSWETFAGERKDEPSIVAMIRLDGTDGALFHRLGEVDPGDVHIGMRVEAEFKPKEERQGSLLDIVHFRPAG